MKILDGKKIADEKIKALKEKIKSLSQKPTLAVILVGNDNSSKIYVNMKEKKARELGLDFKKFVFGEAVMQEKIVYLIKRLNKDKNIQGILIQLPLSEHLNTARIIKNILPEKDVDGLRKDSLFTPPTIQSVIDLLQIGLLEVKHLNAEKNFSVTIFSGKHFRKKLLKALNKIFGHLVSESKNSKDADVVIIAKGKAGFLKADMIKKGAIIIDVGINKTNTGKIVGDVDNDARKKAGFLTPVPGGVGPLTIFNIFKNLIDNK
ncbi:MAG: bifunctional 5,10-methylenetetrahydrofolate dehydrogenase/5,10-methenyltetrahydrofolate cyclohydrolase [Patescibacteria group bacterium]